MSTSTRASSDTWKLRPASCSQRRLPFTVCPRPGTRTTSSSIEIAMTSSGTDTFSSTWVGMQNNRHGTGAANQHQHQLTLEVVERPRPCPSLAMETDAEVTITSPSSEIASTMAIVTVSM